MLAASFWETARERLANEPDLLALWAPAYARELTPCRFADCSSSIARSQRAITSPHCPAIQAESLAAGTQLGREAARKAVREVFGPLPQWRLLHPPKLPVTGPSH